MGFRRLNSYTFRCLDEILILEKHIMHCGRVKVAKEACKEKRE